MTYLHVIDAAATMSVQLDGTLLARINGVEYTLVPDLTLGSIAPEHTGENWWQEGPNRYRMRNLRQFNSSQGFTLR